MSALLEWSTKASYALTELVLFLIFSLVLIFVILLSLVVILKHLKSKGNLIFSVRLLFEIFLPSAVAFTASKKKGHSGSLVLLGYEEYLQTSKSNVNSTSNGKRKLNFSRVWVQVYLIILCGIIMLWAILVFSNSVLYRKSSSCNDLDTTDTDLNCFLLSSRDVPEGVQQLIDEEGGHIVPCQEVSAYIEANNISSTFDLEVVCYQYQLDPVSAMGISYGSMKLVSAFIQYVFTFIFFISQKLCKLNNDDDDKKTSKFLCPLVKHKRATLFIVQILASIVMIVILIAVVVTFHELPGTRNSGLDILRGETFYPFSMVVLTSITVIYTVGLFPWWAFKPLEHPLNVNAVGLSKEEILSKTIYNMFLHHQFSTQYQTELESGVVRELHSSSHAQNTTETEDYC